MIQYLTCVVKLHARPDVELVSEWSGARAAQVLKEKSVEETVFL